jgi:biopolymer transport protein TolR
MNKRYRKRIMAEINIVPYIDVMLVLLVIFMVTAPLLNQGVEVDLPQANTEVLPPDENRTLVLEIDREGTYFLHLAGEPAEALTDDQIRTRTAAALQLNPATPVLVRADKNINYGKVIQAMVLLQQGGAPKVGLATELPEQSE